MVSVASGSGQSRADPTAAGMASIERLVETVDALVPEADTLANAVMPDNSRATRRAGPFFALCAVALVPWIIFIALNLPSRQLSPNYDVAWAGFDVLLFAALASTAGSALRRSRYLANAASWSAALVVTDAWFDVMTAPSGHDRVAAVLMAGLVEIPLAARCAWLAHHAQDIAERRMQLLYRRAAPPRR
jgi:hypothetical protein